MSSTLGDFSQLPMNITSGPGPDTAQNPLPTSPTSTPLFSNFAQPSFASILPSSYPTYPSHPQPDSIQPQYLTNLTYMIGILANNQIAFQQGVMQVLGQPQSAAPLLSSSVKVHNPCMFSGKHKEVTPFLSKVNRIIQFNSVSFPTNNHKVLFLTLYLKDGIPAEWFNNLENHSSFITGRHSSPSSEGNCPIPVWSNLPSTNLTSLFKPALLTPTSCISSTSLPIST